MKLQLQLDRPLVVFDIESTGVNARQDRIVELAAIRVGPDGTETEKCWLLNPGVPIPPEYKGRDGSGRDRGVLQGL